MPIADDFVATAGLVGVAVSALGAVLGAWLTSRTKNRQISVEKRTTEFDAANRMIDQLQEELTGLRAVQEARIQATEKRLTDMELRNGMLVDRADAYRDLLHKHRSHIWDGKPPPPPEWPDDLPR